MLFWFRRWALGASIILISGCAGLQSTIGGAGTMPQAPIGARARLQMPANVKLGDLVYLSGYGQDTYILSFPKGELVGQIGGGGHLCPDNAGNVWIGGYPNGTSDEMVEFSHGGTTPIKTLDLPDRVYNCAVDHTTGNLAVIFGDHGVDVFSGGSPPQTLATGVDFYAGSCTYDGSGNLFLLGGFRKPNHPLGVVELVKRTKKFERLWGYHNNQNYSSIQWDGKYITIGTGLFMTPGVSRYAVRGNNLRPVGGLGFKRGIHDLGAYWISGSKIVATSAGYGIFPPASVYSYPRGWHRVETIGRGVVPSSSYTSIAISTAP